ncbi:MAG: XdhC family protein [Candidatus Rokubacteria bacterium]|nr:XdhC family protein [Candidatus Rokubacteria bacterium]
MSDLLALAYELARRGEPFALATVVRCERPTSAKPGAKALIRKDGTVAGWIGGSCAEPIVVREALRALQDGRPRFIALVGEGGAGPGRREGVLEQAMACHSGGTLEIYVEPVLPKPQLLLIGRGPVLETLERLGAATGFGVLFLPSETFPDRLREIPLTPRTFVVVATHGDADEEALEHVLRSEAAYVSLVASRKRAGAVTEALRTRGVAVERLGRLKAPAGLDIGAVAPEEIAVSILAEIVQVSRSQKSEWTPQEAGAAAATEARDPVCGMSVEIASAKYRSEAAGRPVYFCCARCKQLFDQDPARYPAAD